MNKNDYFPLKGIDYVFDKLANKIYFKFNMTIIAADLNKKEVIFSTKLNVPYGNPEQIFINYINPSENGYLPVGVKSCDNKLDFYKDQKYPFDDVFLFSSQGKLLIHKHFPGLRNNIRAQISGNRIFLYYGMKIFTYRIGIK